MSRFFARLNLQKVSVTERITVLGRNLITTVKSNKGAGLTEYFIIIAIGFIVCAFVGVPKLREFAGSIIDSVKNFYDNVIKPLIFPTT